MNYFESMDTLKSLKIYFRKRLLKWVMIIILGIYIVFSGMNFYSRELAESKETHNVIYLYNEQEYKLVPVMMKEEWIQANTTDRELIQSILLKLSENDIETMLYATIPSTITIRQFRIDQGQVIIDLNSKIFELDPLQESIMKISIIKSLTSFEAFDSVEFFFNGIPIKDDPQFISGKFQQRDTMVSYDEVVNRVFYKTVSIYRPNDKKDKLVHVYEDIPVSSNKKVEEVIIETILKNSEFPIFPKDTKLLNVYTNEEVCFVDFSEECQSNYLPDGISERIAVYSIVNSLTDLPNITHVQFLIEGQVVKTLQGNLSLNRLLTKNYALMDLSLWKE